LVAAGVVAFWVVAMAPLSAQVMVSARDLLADPAAFDGETITVEGELVGDYGFRSDGTVWAQLNSDSYVRAPVVEGGELSGANTGIGVRMPEGAAATLDPPGGYRVRGPIVQATGVWRYHDPGRSGETYLDAAEVVTIEPGAELDEGGDWMAAAAGAVLLLASALIWWRNVSARDRH
jgi:hypothetical protein